MIRIHQKMKPEDDGAEDVTRAFRLSHEEASEGAVKDASDKRPEVLSAAYRILQSGANSRKMLREKLLKKGFSKEEIQNTIEACERQGLLHEKRLFLAHVSYLAEKKHFGKRRIRMEMLKKFDRQSVEEFFDEATAELDFEVLACEEAERCHKRGKRYAVSRLSTLGFSSHEVYEAIASLTWQEEPSDF